jgi:hypothetical protein
MKENTEYPGYFPSMYQVTKEIYDAKQQKNALEELYKWVSSYSFLAIPQSEIKEKIAELMNQY